MLTRINNMSINQLESNLKLPRNALNNYKKGGTPSVYRVLQVANYFGVSVEDLLQNDCGVIVDVEYVFSHLDDSQKFKMCQLCNKWLMEK